MCDVTIVTVTIVTAYSLTMWNLQNLGYMAHKMQVSQIALH